MGKLAQMGRAIWSAVRRAARWIIEMERVAQTTSDRCQKCGGRPTCYGLRGELAGLTCPYRDREVAR